MTPTKTTLKVISAGVITVKDPETGADVELEVMKDPSSGGMLAIDSSYLDQISDFFNSPFDNVLLHAPDVDASSNDNQRESIKTKINDIERHDGMNFEALAVAYESLITALSVAQEALCNVPEVGSIYDQQHSDTHMAASVVIGDVMDAAGTRHDRAENEIAISIASTCSHCQADSFTPCPSHG